MVRVREERRGEWKGRKVYKVVKVFIALNHDVILFVNDNTKHAIE